MNKKVLKYKASLMSNTFNRTKMFHSKKGWLVSSILFLALLGFGIGVSNISVNADSTIPSVRNVSTEINSTLSNTNRIQLKAVNLHRNIMNVNAQAMPSNIITNNHMKFNVNNNNIDSSSKISNFSSNLSSSGASMNDANSKMANNGQFRKHTFILNKSEDNRTGSYNGLTYIYNLNNKSLEFLNGKANGSFIHFISNANGDNSCIKDAKSIKFDNDVDVSQVPDMSFMFASDSNLQSLDLGNNFNTVNNTNTALMFHNDTNLQSIDLGPKFYTNKVRNMYEMFGNSTNKLSHLQSINLGNNFDTSNVGIMSGMFQGLTSLHTLIIPSENTKFSSDTYLPDMYLRDTTDSYTKLAPQNITNHNSCQGVWVSRLNTRPMIYSDIYNNIDNKNESVQDTSVPAGYTTVDSQGHPVLSPIVDSENHVQIAPIYHGLVYKYNKDNNSVEFTGGKANGSFIRFISNANGNDSCIKNANFIKFDNDVDVSQVPDMSFMFASDSNLQSLDLGNNFNTANNTNTALMFHNDVNLQSINLGTKFYTNKVRNMYGMFNGSSIQSINLGPNFDTSNVTNMSDMFNQVPVQTLIVSSPNTKFNDTAELTTLFRKNNNGYSTTPNDFSKGVTGTFVNTNVIEGVTPTNDPNKYMANDDPALLSNQWNQNFHFNNPQGANNDIESIVPHYNNNKVDYWDIYYLWNPDPGNPGQNAYDEWGVTRTKDFSSFQPVDINNPVSLNNVAIPNPSYEINGKTRVEVASTTPDNIIIPWYQAAGGSVISNKKADGSQWLTHDTFGNSISPNARLAYFANYKPNNTGSYLAYANPNNNGGYQQFRPYSENNIFTGKDVGVGITGDFRDPYVTTNPLNHNQLVAYCAGGFTKKVFVLTSNDAIHWTASTPINVSNLLQYTLHNEVGSAETPYVTVLNNTPILFMSEQSNHSNEGMAYATGTINNKGIFQLTSNSKFGDVDLGHDVYAGNFDKLDSSHLIFIGWLNNWDYFNGAHAGGFTLPRIVSWNGNHIDVTPIEPSKPANVTDENNNDTYNVNGKISFNYNIPINMFNVKFTRSNNVDNHISFNFNNGVLTINRSGSANGATNINNSVNLGVSSLSNIQFYLDNNSIEAYIPEIRQMYSVLDYDNNRNIPYTITSNVSNVPVKINSYQFDMGHAPVLDNINGINSKYLKDKTNFTKDLNAINYKSHISNDISLLNDDLNYVQNQLQNANTNINQAKFYTKDARQHIFVALANDDMNMANTKLYQVGFKLKKLDDIAIPYLDASSADTRIANYYKSSVANSVASANKSKASSAAKSADNSIVDFYKNSVSNSVLALNKNLVQSAVSSADKSIENSISNSVANVIAYDNGSKANSAKNAADTNIAQSVSAKDSSIASSAASVADNSIANYYRNSVANSVSAANKSKADVAAKSANQNIASSEAAKSVSNSIKASIASANASASNSAKNAILSASNSAKNAENAEASIASSEAKKANNNRPASSADNSNNNKPANNNNGNNVMPNIPFIPSVNPVIPASSSSTTSMTPRSAAVSSAKSATPSSASHHTNKTTGYYKNVANNHIALNGISRHAGFYVCGHAVKLSRKAARSAQVVAVVRKGNKVQYTVKADKLYGHVYGNVNNVKPLFATYKHVNVHFGRRVYRLSHKNVKRISVVKAVRKGAKVVYTVKVTHKRGLGIVYLTATKRVFVPYSHKNAAKKSAYTRALMIANRNVRRARGHYTKRYTRGVVRNLVNIHKSKVHAVAKFNYCHSNNNRKAMKRAEYRVNYAIRALLK